MPIWLQLLSSGKPQKGPLSRIMVLKAVVPSMRRLGWAEGPASFFMSYWINADLVTHICPRV